MKRLFALAACLCLGGLSSFAAVLTIGAPGNPNDGDCAPFGCAVQYQQVYGASQFPGLITITDLTFFNNNFVPGDIATANYTISLSTTSAAVNGLDSTFANNLGADNAVFFTGPLGGTIGPTNQFTITGTPFVYNPANGNLLLSILSDGSGQDFTVFLDFLSGAPSGMFSRAYSFDNSGVASSIESDTGLVTQFTFDAAGAQVPEPTTLSFAVAGLGILGAIRLVRS